MCQQVSTKRKRHIWSHMLILLFLVLLTETSLRSSARGDELSLSWYSAAIARSIDGRNVTNRYIEEQSPLERQNWVEYGCDRTPCRKTFVNCDWEKLSSSSYDCVKVRVAPKTFPEPLGGYCASSTECLHLFKLEDDLMSKGDFDPLRPYRRQLSMYSRPKFPRAFRLFEYGGNGVCLSEIVEGVPLKSHMLNVKTNEDAYDLIVAMLDVLSMLSRSHIIHRDIQETNVLVYKDESDSYSIALIDFTWAYSPTVKGMFPPPYYLNINHRPSNAENIVRKTGVFNAEDIYSVGSLLKDMLTMYTNVDVLRWTDIFSAMTSYCDILDCAVLALRLLTQSEVASAAHARSEVDRERQEICKQLDMDTRAIDAQMRHVEDFDGDNKAAFTRISGRHAFQVVVYRESKQIKLKPLSRALIEASDLLTPIIGQVAKNMTILDVGGSYGYFSAMAAAYGAKLATIVDMDEKFATKASEIYDFLGTPFSDRVVVQNKKLSEADNFSADIVFALSHIHGFFSCSESDGNLARAIGQLARRAKKLLIIEWIDSYDQATQPRDRLSQSRSYMAREEEVNPNTVAAWRSFANFENVMRRIFTCKECLVELELEQQVSTPSRRIFVGIHMTPSITVEENGENGTNASNSRNLKYAHINDLFGLEAHLDYFLHE